ncbi:ATP-binding protein [Membranihabitans maritimus]|uniref:ATP-binding protein n=1 Tax=Membranihabitans maritimus TaxID=2904244 RepID=UPI001F44EE12|nr:ATP-binding protein [Membranihabitans maritimus]
MASKLTISSELENIKLIDSFLKRLEANYCILPKKFIDIKLSILEAVNNAIIHGNKFDSDKTVSITEAMDHEILEIRINDQGSGFNFNEVKDPTLKENILSPGGRGIHLMRNLTDSFKFTNDGKCVILRFKI